MENDEDVELFFTLTCTREEEKNDHFTADDLMSDQFRSTLTCVVHEPEGRFCVSDGETAFWLIHMTAKCHLRTLCPM